jgi:cell volume regulation protein A
MSIANELILAGAFLLFAGILLGYLSSRAGMPLLLVFLLVGMLAGEDGPGGIALHDFGLAFVVGHLALAIILLDGGLRTRYSVLRLALGPAVALASAGVLITAAVVGAAAVWLLGWDWRLGLLLGAIVGSTDAAAVFAILRASSVRLNDRLAATLEVESGTNDPMAVFLTIALIELVLRGGDPGLALLASLSLQLGVGGVAGAAFGVALAWLLRRIVLSEGLYALLIASGGLVAFAVTNQLGGSGFLAIYLVGLIVGNRRTHADEDVLRAMDGLAWLSQAGMFLLLGLLVTPSQLDDLAPVAIVIAAVLMFVARPLAVVVCLAPFRFAARELAFVSWVGLRGAVPIVLAVFPVMAGVPGAMQLFNIAFFVVLVSLLVQGSSVGMVARRLHVGVPPRAEPVTRVAIECGGMERGGYEFAQFAIGAGSIAEGSVPVELMLPGGVTVAAAFRAGAPLPLERGALAAGDLVCLLGPAEALDAAGEVVTAAAPQADLTRAAVFGDFTLDAGQSLGEVVAFYGVALDDARLAARSLREVLDERLHGRAVEGDAVEFGAIELTVREVRDGRIERVGLKLR